MCRWRWGVRKVKYAVLARVKPKVRARGRRKWGSGGCRAANGYIWAAADAVGHAPYLRKKSLCLFYVFFVPYWAKYLVMRRGSRERGMYPRRRT